MAPVSVNPLPKRRVLEVTVKVRSRKKLKERRKTREIDSRKKKKRREKGVHLTVGVSKW